MRRFHSTRQTAGITTRELCVSVLVVVVFVVLVVSGLFPHLGSVRDSPRANSSMHVKAVVNAVNNCFPAVGTPRNAGEGFVLFGAKAAGCMQSNRELLDVLRGISRGANTGHVLNSRQVKYYESKKATQTNPPRDGFADSETFPIEQRGCFFDEWGSEYCIVIETDGDELLDLSGIYSDLTGEENFVRYSVGAFSLGKDGKLGGKGYEGRYKKAKSNEPPDDRVSW